VWGLEVPLQQENERGIPDLGAGNTGTEYTPGIIPPGRYAGSPGTGIHEQGAEG